jgi:hypothetical protein
MGGGDGSAAFPGRGELTVNELQKGYRPQTRTMDSEAATEPQPQTGDNERAQANENLHLLVKYS